MLGLLVLMRASVAPFRHLRVSLVLALPCFALAAVYTAMVVGYLFEGVVSWAVQLGLVVVFGLTVVTVAIAWHRTLLSPVPLPLVAVLRGQPTFRYVGFALLFGIGMLILSAAPMYGVLQLRRFMQTDMAYGGGWNAVLQFEVFRFLANDAERMISSFFFVVLGIGLPGLAIGSPLPFRRCMGFALRNLHHIAVATFGLALMAFVAERMIKRLLILASLGDWPLRLPLAIVLYSGLAWFTLFCGIGILTEFHRVLRAKTNAPQG